MDHFNYRNGVLHAEDVPLPEIAAAVGTPVYIYSTATLRRHYKVFTDAFAGARASVYYAVKANSNLAVIKTLADMGAGADVVSEGELRRALAAGVPPERIVFSGVGKTAEELAFALDTGILEINVESENELTLLNEVAGARGKKVEIAIRVNPDVDAKTHHKISTGKKENKFGIDIDRAVAIFKRAQAMDEYRTGYRGCAYRIAIDRPGALSGGVHAVSRTGSGIARGRHRHSPRRSRRRFGHSLCRRNPAPCPMPMRPLRGKSSNRWMWRCCSNRAA